MPPRADEGGWAQSPSSPLTASRSFDTLPAMLDAGQVIAEITAYRLKLLAMTDRYTAGERSRLAGEAQEHADALVCLMEESPLEHRAEIDYLIDRYETLRISCMD